MKNISNRCCVCWWLVSNEIFFRAIWHEQLDAGGSGRDSSCSSLNLRVWVVQPSGTQHEGSKRLNTNNFPESNILWNFLIKYFWYFWYVEYFIYEDLSEYENLWYLWSGKCHTHNIFLLILTKFWCQIFLVEIFF